MSEKIFFRKNDIPSKVTLILDRLCNAGHEAYIVGGCVRDLYMGRTPSDWDITTSALPQETKELFSQEYRIIDVGLDFGTVCVLIDDEIYEITTYRVDGEYSDNRKPDSVAYTSRLEEDLRRRDFTMNAMAYNPSTGLVDLFSGISSIDRKEICCVGEPAERFSEDALRILRALRFAARFGFSVEERTAQAVFDYRERLKNISNERIKKELEGIIMSRNCGCDVFRSFFEVFCEFIPEIRSMAGFSQNNPHHIYDVFEHTLHCMEYESVSREPADITLRLAVLFHDIGKPLCYTEDENGVGHFYGHAKISAKIAEKILKRLRFENEVTEAVVSLTEMHDIQLVCTRAYVKRRLNRMGCEMFRKLLLLKRFDFYGQNRAQFDEKAALTEAVGEIMDNILEENACFSLKDLAVNGKDIMALGIKEGKQIGRILDLLLERVIEEKTENTKESLTEYIIKIKDNYNA